MRDPGLGSREPSFEVGSWLGQVEPNVSVVGGRWAKLARFEKSSKCHACRGESRPLPSVHVRDPLSPRDETSTGDLSQFCTGNRLFTFFRPVSVLSTRHRRRPRICCCREWLSNELRELELLVAPICPCSDTTRIAPHRIAPHRIASHRIEALRPRDARTHESTYAFSRTPHLARAGGPRRLTTAIATTEAGRLRRQRRRRYKPARWG